MMEFPFHKSYVILELVSSTVIFWTEHSYLRKRYSNKVTFLLGWSHRYNKITVVITIWLTITKYPCQMTINVLLLEDVSFLIYCQRFYRAWLYIWDTRRLSYDKYELFTLPDHLSSSAVFWWVPCCSYFMFLCCVFRYDFRIKRCSVRLYRQLFGGGRTSYFHFLCLFARSGVQHIWCCVFVLFFFVFCTLYCQFLWIVLSWLALRCSLKLIPSSDGASQLSYINSFLGRISNS